MIVSVIDRRETTRNYVWGRYDQDAADKAFRLLDHPGIEKPKSQLHLAEEQRRILTD